MLTSQSKSETVKFGGAMVVRLGHNEAGRSNVAPIFERRDMGQKTRHAASVSQKGVCIVAPVGVGGESLRGIGVISGGACPLAGLTDGQVA